MASKRELAVTELLARDERSRHRYLDMQVIIELPAGRSGTGEELIRVGGRWDRVEERYVGDAPTAVVLRLEPAQVEGAMLWAEWLQRHLRARHLMDDGVLGDDALDIAWGDSQEQPWFELLFYGGRRGGKSLFASAAIGLNAIAIPRGRFACVSPKQDDTDELRLVLERRTLASSWRTWKSDSDLLLLANGSKILMLTGNVEQLKKGTMDGVLINEAQEQNEKIAKDLRGGCADTGGLTLVTANPPRSSKGQWVQDMHDAIRDGKRPGSRAVYFDTKKNRRVVHAALRSLASTMEANEERREIDGDMGAPVGKVVFTTYSDSVNLRDWLPTDWRDVTRAVAERWYGRPASRVGGLDFDRIAGCSYVAGRFFLPPKAQDLWESRYWIEYGALLRDRDEYQMAEFLAALKDDYGFPLLRTDDTVFAADASGQTQSTRREHGDPDDHPSWKVMSRHSWCLVTPDARERRNPRRDSRFDLQKMLLRPDRDHGLPHVLVHPRALDVVESMRRYPLLNGRPNPKSDHAHPADAWGYAAWRRWGDIDERDRVREAVAAVGSVIPFDRAKSVGL